MIKKCDNKLKPLLVPTMKSLGTSIDDYTKVVSDVLQSGSEVNDTQNADAASKNAVVHLFFHDYCTLFLLYSLVLQSCCPTIGVFFWLMWCVATLLCIFMFLIAHALG